MKLDHFPRGETTLDKIDPITLGSGLILDLCQSFGYRHLEKWIVESPMDSVQQGLRQSSHCVFV